MRNRLIALGVLGIALAAPAAHADGRYDDDRQRDGWHERWHDRGGERDRYEDMRRDRCALERDRARLAHEWREGDWREVEQLRRRIWWEERDLHRDRWQEGYER